MSAARVRSWRAGWELSQGDSLFAPWLADDATAVVLGASAEVVDPLEALRERATESVAVHGTRREILRSLSDEVRLDRAIGRLGLPRRFVDRYLDARVEIQPRVLATGFGGLGPAWWRQHDGEPVAIRFDRARRGGWLALELAALGHEGEGEVFELARLAVGLRQGTLDRDLAPATDLAQALLRPATTVSVVRVNIEGPELARAVWEKAGARVSAARARWLLREIDGIFIAGEKVSVETEPKIRAGRRSPRREPRGVRQRRLFSRWGSGVRVDDEGLVGLTPERLALDIASRASGVVIDGTCGVGGLTIALARSSEVDRVIAVDVSEERLAMARHNAGIYGVADKIRFVLGDVVELLEPADVLLLDPPWGGRSYDRERVTLDDLPMRIAAALERFEGQVLLKLPRSFDPRTLPPKSGADWTIELLLDEREIPKMLLATRNSNIR